MIRHTFCSTSTCDYVSFSLIFATRFNYLVLLREYVSVRRISHVRRHGFYFTGYGQRLLCTLVYNCDTANLHYFGLKDFLILTTPPGGVKMHSILPLTLVVLVLCIIFYSAQKTIKWE